MAASQPLVFLVEDSQTLALLYQDYLRDEGYQLRHFAEGKPVLAAIKVGQSGLDGVVEVLSGIAEGDEIIVHSERELREGGRIKVVEQLAGRKP